jgi:sulfopropanediol 3-dehydrogenase
MTEYLKRGASQAAAHAEEEQVRTVVQKMIEEIGDSAVREYSEKLDRWSPQKLPAQRGRTR